MSGRLVARLDNLGDVLLAGPAVRAVAAAGEPVTFLASRVGTPAARMLPGVDHVITFDAPWVAYDAPVVDEGELTRLIARVGARGVTEAVVLTSFHQSPLPLALLLRLAGVERIGATCVDFPGRLLDVRHPYLDDLHEVEQALSLVAAMGFRLPPGDDGELRIELDAPVTSGPPGQQLSHSGTYVVLHPGASVPARAIADDVARDVAEGLLAAGWGVVITGSRSEARGAERIAADVTGVVSRAGLTDFRALAHVIDGAAAVVCGNTGVAHLAAAVGTPVIEAFAPVVPAHRWRPWRVPHVLLGDQDVACAGCRALECRFDGQPCLAPFTSDAVLDAVESLAGGDRPSRCASSPARIVSGGWS
jgi:heptosyltransferase III